MSIKQFIDAILGREGLFCSVSVKNRATHRFHTYPQGVVKHLAEFNQKGNDAYFAVATYSEKKRTSVNVKGLKSFFLDIDIGDKGYSSKQEALVELKRFCKETSMPKPTVIVDSGGGIHAYWALVESLDRLTWKPMAESLKMLCVEHNFRTDPAPTADPARILRLPGTLNYKYEEPVRSQFLTPVGQCYELGVLEEVLGKATFEQEVLELPARQMSEEDQQMMGLVMGNYRKSFARILDKTNKGKGCAQIARAVLKPNKVTYPQWLDVLSITEFCEEGRKASYAVSKKYNNFKKSETDKIADSITAPHLCATFSANNPGGCEGCPHIGKIKSPITLGLVLQEAPEGPDLPLETAVANKEVPVDSLADSLFEQPTEHLDIVGPVVPKYPFPYIRPANGGIFIKTKDRDGDEEEVEVYHQDIYPVKRIRDPILGACTLIRYHTQLDGIKEFVVQSTKLLSKEDFKKEMGYHGVLTMNPEPLMRYFLAWSKKLEKSLKEEEALTQFGWTRDMDSFVIGGRRVYKDKVLENPPSVFTQGLFKALEPKGTLEAWKRAADFINRPGFEAHQYMVGLSFASPLMVFVPNINGGIFNLYSSSSGLGKSQAQFLGASVWGDYSELVMRGGDTDNAIWNRAEVMKNITLYVEEVTNMHAELASAFAYKSGEGKQKNRMSNAGQNRERYRGDSWNLLLGMSSNAKLGEKIAQKKALPKGEMQRIIEVEAFKLLDGEEDIIAARQFNEAIKENYGHAAVPYVQMLLKNLPAAKALVNRVSEALIKKAYLGVENRIWLAQCATTLAGLMIAKQVGLINYDIDALFVWVVKMLQRQKQEVRQLETNIGDVISNYIAENIRGILRVRSTADNRVQDMPNVEVHSAPDATPTYNWVARHEFDINQLHLLQKPFKKWCTAQQMDFNEVMRLIERDFHGKRDRIRLGKGTKLNLPPSYVISLRWDDELPEDEDNGSKKEELFETQEGS